MQIYINLAFSFQTKHKHPLVMDQKNQYLIYDLIALRLIIIYEYFIYLTLTLKKKSSRKIRCQEKRKKLH